jgi:hypothetical protein
MTCDSFLYTLQLSSSLQRTADAEQDIVQQIARAFPVARTGAHRETWELHSRTSSFPAFRSPARILAANPICWSSLRSCRQWESLRLLFAEILAVETRRYNVAGGYQNG